MTTEQCFLRAILMQPDDDDLRLVYADWLEERGDPRGEFIRVQMRLVAPERTPDEDRELTQRQAELLAAHEDEWFGPIKSLAVAYQSERGFVHAVHMTGEAFLEHAAQLLELAPIRRVRLQVAPEGLPKLLACPFLAAVTALDLRDNQLGDDGAFQIAECRWLSRVADLNLSTNLIGLRGARAIAAAQCLPLRALDLGYNAIEDLGLYALTQATYAPSLTTLAIPSCDIGPQGVRYLIKTENFKNLHHLDLAYNLLGDDGVRSLAQSGLFGQLKSLKLRANQIGGLGVQALVTAPNGAHFEALDLSENAFNIHHQEAVNIRFGKGVLF